jgi:hypothetical protein
MERNEMCVCGHPQSLHRTYGCTGTRANPDPKKNTTEFGANAKHSKNPKLPTVSHEEQRLTPHDSGHESQNVFRCGLAIDWPCMGILVTQ